MLVVLVDILVVFVNIFAVFVVICDDGIPVSLITLPDVALKEVRLLTTEELGPRTKSDLNQLGLI